MANNELVNPMDSEELSDYIIIVLNHLDKITDISSMDELIELLEFSPDGIKLYSKVLQDCKKFYTDNKRFPDINYIISLHNILVHKKDCPFSLDILIKLKKELIRHKQISEVKNAIDKNDISKVRDILRQDVDVTKPKLLGMEDIFDVYERQELMPRGVMIGIPEVDHYLKGLDYGTLNVIGAPPQSFKTTFAISTAYTASYREGKKVLFITLEVVPRNVLYNIVSRHSYEMYGKQGAIPAVDLKKTLLLEDSKEKFKEVKDNFLQTCKGDLRIAGVNDLEEYSMEYIEAFILRMRDEMGGLDLVYVDYLNLFKNKIPPKLKLDQYQALNYYVDTLQEIAVKHNLIIVLLAQLKTEAIDKLEAIVEKAEKSGTPSSNTKLASSTYFAEANALGRTAMTAMIFHCTTAMRNAKVVNIHIVKNRDFESPDKPIPSPIMPEFFVFGTQGSNFTNCSVLSPSFNNSVSTGTQDINSLADDFVVGDIEDIGMDDNVPTSEIANTEGVTVIGEEVLPNIEDIITLDDLMKEPNDESK